MNKVLKIVGKIMLILLAVLLIFTVVTYFVHRVKSKEELEVLQQNGLYNPVSVGDYSLNVAKFGNEDGKHTIVAIAGLGMGDCSVSMRQMTAGLEEDNLVVFVDRAGYGLSDDTNNEMTLEYIVEDYRKALKNSGVEGPYILMPHSIGGVYATYWCSQYPEEIEAVVFIDGTQLSANTYDGEEIEKSTWGNYVLSHLEGLGFGRYFLRDSFYYYPDNYSDVEQYLGDALSIAMMGSVATLSECDHKVENAQKAFDTIVTNEVPKLYICASWGFETREDFADYLKWMNRQIEINKLGKEKNENPTDEKVAKLLEQCEELRTAELLPYLNKMGNCQLICLGGDHMIYEQKPEECGNIINEFLDKLGG
jgi:pimeloyl-ACP methyl ester carboxylesterase